jgi:hypothetical protein
MRIIKRWPLAIGSTARILSGEGVRPDLIVTVGSGSDGGGGFFFDSIARARQSGRTPWSLAWASSSSSYGAWNAVRFDPTRSTRQGKPVLQTYGEGNGRWRVGDGGAIWSVLGDGEGSSSTASSCSPQAPPWVNCFGRWWIELVMWLSLCTRVWGLRDKIQRERAAIYRVSWSYS